MKPTEFREAKERTPTIGGVIDQIRVWGADRAAVVREEEPHTQAGLAIFMLSKDAVKAIGPHLVGFAAAHTNDSNTAIPFTMASEVKGIFETIEQSGNIWFWSKLPEIDDDVRKGKRRQGEAVIFFVIGTDYCHKLAPMLNGAGCTVNMTPTSEL